MLYCLLSLLLFLPTTLALPPNQYAMLKNITEAEKFSFEDKVFLAKVQKVVDGDSLKVIFLVCDQFQRFDARIAGIDTPEIRSGVVREFGKKVRDILKMIEGKIVRIRAGKFDKYGRLLADVWALTEEGELIKINDYLVDHLMAKRYDGGKKTKFTQEDYDLFKAEYGNTVWPKFIDYHNSSEQ